CRRLSPNSLCKREPDMPFFHKESGALCFADGLNLYASMPPEALPLEAKRSGSLCLAPRAVRGGELAAMLLMGSEGLCGVVLTAPTVGGRAEPDAGRQRAFLFDKLHLRDPWPDTWRSVRVRCPFGEILISSDPYTGGASARLTYAERKA
ncbi:MAG: hypothetical protein RSC91_05865, partial [Clostridia bacterium]